MSVEVTRETAPDTWNSSVYRSTRATPFHQYAVLELLAGHTGADLHPLVGYKGQEVVGILPIFETEWGPFTALYSPPLEAELMHLGPLWLRNDGMKQRTIEKTHRRFVDACWDWIETTADPDFVSLRCSDRYGDVRPYLWNGFEATPQYIYVVDLEADIQSLFDALTKETRRQIRNTDDDAYEIVEGDTADVRLVVRQIQRRLEEQGVQFGLTPEVVARLCDRLPDEQVHPYCLRVGGKTVSGLLSLEFGDTMHVWLGGAKASVDLPVNELLYWHAIERTASMGLDRVDLTTAMIPDLANYKAKFGPDARTVFNMEWRSPAWQAASFGYQRLPERGQHLIQSLLS